MTMWNPERKIGVVGHFLEIIKNDFKLNYKLLKDSLIGELRTVPTHVTVHTFCAS